jgi:4-hydroxy-tetrahydrodipicolinate reductase
MEKMKKKIVLAGSGKLANAVLDALRSHQEWEAVIWDEFDRDVRMQAIVIHAGSGRHLEDIFSFCSASKSVLVELSTGTPTESRALDFPRVICSNTSIAIVKFLFVLAEHGKLFANSEITIEESHQASKTSVPGTAVDIARSLNVSPDRISSCRNQEQQKNALGIPEEFLERHAYHRVRIKDGDSLISLETRVLGHKPYSDGVLSIVAAIAQNALEPRKYDVTDFVRAGWL